MAYPVIHKKPEPSFSFERLNMLWNKYPQFHEKTTFTTLEGLLEEHESYRKDFEGLEDIYKELQLDRFLIQLSWSDLAYRYETKQLIEADGPLKTNPFVATFIDQFKDLDYDHKAYFLFPESYCSQYFVIQKVCERAESCHVIQNLFPDEKQIHYLATFDKQDMDTILLMHHLLYFQASKDFFGGYSLYDYSLGWYHHHLEEAHTVLRSPYLPDALAKYQGNLPYYHHPAKTIYVRRNIEHMIQEGYFESELECFRQLTEVIMPFFEWWYQDIVSYEKKDGLHFNWRLERTKIRTELTNSGIINPKWKHELTLFKLAKKLYPDTLYQYRPDWLERQSLDLYIPSLNLAIEYQGVQHYKAIDFFGGEEALEKRKELDELKRARCLEQNITLIEWPYSLDPTKTHFEKMIENIAKK